MPAPASRPPPPPPADLIDLSAFAPDGVRAGEAALVQVFIALADQAAEVEAAARAADPDARARGAVTLELEIARGARVDIVLEAPGLAIDQPVQHLTWRGRPIACPFLVTAPAAGASRAPVTVQAFIDGIPVGRLGFTLKVAGHAAQPAVEAAAQMLQGERAKRYRHAFLSYCSADRLEVLKRVDAIRAVGLGFFQDILSIDPGEAWEPRLYAEIDRCDLFLLFWSSHAAASPWVLREAEYALERRQASSEALPDITPIILEGPPTPLPPASLSALHFNDVLRYVAAAAEAEQRTRAPA